MAKKFLPQNQVIQSTITTIPTTLSAITPNKNEDNRYIAEVTHALLSSKFNFYLGGSRAMLKRGAKIQIDDNTDYNFYATYTPDIENFLLSLNFSLDALLLLKYDNECLKVFVKDSINIALRNDAEFYKKVFDNISLDLYTKHLWKTNPQCDHVKIKLLFNEMFKIAVNKQNNKST